MNNKSLLIILVLVGTLTLTLFVAQNQQSIRQFASTAKFPNSTAKNNENKFFIPPNITLTPPHKQAYDAPNDTIPPHIVFKNPASGTRAKINTTLKLTANASDNRKVARVEFLVNGGIICSVKSSPYSCSWAIPFAKNITYTVVARAYDQTGNVSSKNIIVTSF